MIASSWGDPVVGIDMHWEMVPTPAPVPMPFPHPFVGIVLDLEGLIGGVVMGAAMSAVFGAPFAGPVLHWSVPATNTGTSARHVPGHFIIPPGTIWAPVPRTPKPAIHPGEVPRPAPPVMPENDAISILGSLTVHVGGTNGVRLGDIFLSCSEPVRLPSSVVLAIPKGPPILIGGPPGLDLMAAITASLRTRFVSDSLHALVSRLKPSRFRNLLHKGVCFFTGHPVDVASGKVVTSAVEIELPGPLPLRIERSYSSAFADRDGPLGHGWSLSLDQAVWTERGKVVLLSDDGREIEFDTFDLPNHQMRPGDEVRNPIDRLTLRRLPEDCWQVTDADGETRQFTPVPGRTDARAMIRRWSSPCGAHVIAYEYDSRGMLERVRDACGRVVGVQRDERGRVSALELPAPEGQGSYVHRRYAYDARGDLTQVTDALGHAWRFAYATHLLVRETDRTGLSFCFEYDGNGQEAWCTRTWGDGGIYDHRLAYDKIKKVTAVTDSLGRTTRYRMNLAGLVVQIVDPLGAETSYEYDARTLRRTKQVDPRGAITRWRIDGHGNVTEVVGPGGDRVVLERDDAGLLRRALDATGGEWSWEYDARRRVRSEVAPDGRQTRLEYDGGLIARVLRPGGWDSSFEYDRWKSCTRVRSGTGEQRTRRDLLGRELEFTDARGGIVQLRRDLEGRVLAVRAPTGLIQELRWDAEGNLLEARDATRHVRLRYGHFHRVIEREEGGASLRFEYDSEDRLVGVVNAAGERYALERDANGRVVAETGFDGRTRRYHRDRAGRAEQVELPSGRKRLLRYDEAGRLAEVVNADGARTVLTYGPGGVVRAARNESAEVVFERDTAGRVVREAQRAAGAEHWVRSFYGASGFRDALASSLGSSVSRERDPSGAVTQVVLGKGDDVHGPDRRRAVQFGRGALGEEVARLLPPGIRVEWERDAAGRPIGRRTIRAAAQADTAGAPVRVGSGAPVEQVLRYEWRGADQLAAIWDSTNGEVRYAHDERGRLVGAAGADGATTTRAWDGAGNVYRRADRTDRSYAPGGRLEAADGVVYRHDEDGNRIEARFPDGATWRYRWNDDGLLREVERPDGLSVRFEYDPFARRTRKAVVRVEGDGRETVLEETRFVWDGPALLHELRSGAEPVTWYWDDDAFTLVGKEEGGRWWYAATDHLGTPTELFDDAGGVVWSDRLDLFGGSSSDTADCPWRWPGQYADAETGLCYNRFRYYDPGAGRYISPDPARLAGGFEPYSYAADPLLWADPFGLIIVFRNLRPDENPASGLVARRPGRNMTPAGHVRNGSKPNFRGSQFISTTTDPAVALRYREPGQRTVMIDTDLLEADAVGNRGVVDLSTPELASEAGLRGPAQHYAANSSEVLLEGRVPPSAMAEVSEDDLRNSCA